MMSISEFLHMGGYGLYVWGSYGLTVVVLYLNYILPVRNEQRLIKKLSNLQRSKAE
jgi:heme exporter protein D